MTPDKDPDDDAGGEEVGQEPGVARPPAHDTGGGTSGMDDRPLTVEGVPIVPVRLPRPPDRVADAESGGRPDARHATGAGKGRGGSAGRGKTSSAGSGFRVVEHFPSTLAKWLFGYKDEHGGLKLGLVSRRYQSRADELVLDSDDCDLLDEAFAGPFKKLLKLLGLTSEEMAMIVVGVVVMMPRIGVIVEEESDKAKKRKAELEAGGGATHAGRR